MTRRCAVALAAAMLAACAQPEGRAAPAPSPEPSSATFTSPAMAVNAFGVDLLRELATNDENVVISPLSVAIAMSMVANGADGEARAELERALRVSGPEDRRNAELAALLDDLVSARDADVRIAQSLWAHQGFPFRPEYIERVQTTFQAALEEVDLGSAATANMIDAWVADRTEGLIETIAADLGLPNPLAVLVLLNATYFHGTWTTSFDPDDTRQRRFGAAGGQAPRVPFLTATEVEFAHEHTATRQLLRLPYGDTQRFVMDVYLPTDGHDVSDVLGELADDPAPEATQMALVELPKLELRWEQQLKPALQALGVTRIWTPGALGRMSPSGDIYLDAVMHKTYIEVDEKGTKAAAVTGAVALTSAPAGPSFVADQPFAFAIRDTATGVVMFSGVVNNPAA